MRAPPNDIPFGHRSTPPGAGEAASAARRTIVVRSARWKTAALALTSVFLALVAVLEIRFRLSGGFGLGLLLELAAPLLLLSGAFVLAALVIRRPILTISRDGLALRHLRGGVWAWREIERIEMRLSRRGFLQVVLRLCDESGGTMRRRLPGMWATSPHQLAAMLEAGRRTAAKGRPDEVLTVVEAAREAHTPAGAPFPIDLLARAVQRIF